MFLTRVFSLGISLLLASQALSSPVHVKTRHEVLTARGAPPAPYFVVHSDLFTGSNSPPDPSLLAGYNVYSLAFLVLAGAKDNARAWALLTDAQRSSIKSQYAAAGIKLMVTAFGDTNTPTTSGADPIATANMFASWVIQYQLDGIDIDYEDFQAFNAGNGKAEDWLITFTQQLRKQLPMGQYIITHSPVAPWFAPNAWGGGGYLKINSAVGNLIDWYNVQFYNQGSNEYTTCSGLLDSSTSKRPNSALFQISANGIPLSKIVIGKPATSQLAYSGYMDTSTLASCLGQAKNQGWNGGAMVWQYPDADASWIANVRSQSWPVS